MEFYLQKYKKTSLEEVGDNNIVDVPMILRYKYDKKRVPILHTVILIIIIMCILGIVTSMYLNTYLEKTILSLFYCILLLSAAMNQGLIDRRWQILDNVSAFSIFLLNIYFWILSMKSWHFVVSGIIYTHFFIYNYYHAALTVRWYEINTNIWHVGVIILIYLVPFHLEQNNLF